MGIIDLPNLLVGLVIGALGFWLQTRISEGSERRREAFRYEQEDLKDLRNQLRTFIGPLQAHFVWLQSPHDSPKEGELSPAEKANMIGEWVYNNALRHPEARRRPMYLISNVAYQLARGDRSFLEIREPDGWMKLQEAWDSLDKYQQELSNRLYGKT